MGDISVGKPDTKVDASAHTPGVNQGNEPGGTDADPGLEETGEIGAGRPSMRSWARKSTGINCRRTSRKRGARDPGAVADPGEHGAWKAERH
jgi:hypothetical protein